MVSSPNKSQFLDYSKIKNNIEQVENSNNNEDRMKKKIILKSSS